MQKQPAAGGFRPSPRSLTGGCRQRASARRPRVHDLRGQRGQGSAGCGSSREYLTPHPSPRHLGRLGRRPRAASSPRPDSGPEGPGPDAVAPSAPRGLRGADLLPESPGPPAPSAPRAQQPDPRARRCRWSPLGAAGTSSEACEPWFGPGRGAHARDVPSQSEPRTRPRARSRFARPLRARASSSRPRGSFAVRMRDVCA